MDEIPKEQGQQGGTVCRDSRGLAGRSRQNGDSLLAQSLAEWNGSADEAEAGAIKTWEEVTSANSLADVAHSTAASRSTRAFVTDSATTTSSMRPSCGPSSPNY
jgi:hypothetical protein